MNFADFKNELEEGKLYNTYLLEGEDGFFLERGLCLLKEKLLGDDTLNYLSYNGEEIEIDDLISSLNTIAFFGGNRLTVIKEFYPKAEVLKKLTPFFDKPIEGSFFVIVNSKVFEGFNKANNITHVNCGKGDMSILVKFIKAECSKLNVSIDGETAKTLAEFCSSDMVRIKTETDKLMCFVGKGGEISKDNVVECVAKDTEYKIYELTDYIAQRKNDLALFVIKDLISKGETPQRLISSTYNYFRKLLHVAISNMSVEELAKTFGVKEYAIKMTIKQSALFKKKELKNAVDMLSEADYKIKCGMIDANEALNLIVFKIMKK